MPVVQCELSACEPPRDEIKEVLQRCKRVAMVGLSPKEERDSNMVARYLMEHGYDVVPVNPGQREILGKTCYKSLRDIPFRVDLVDLFLNPTRVPPVVDQALTIGVGVIWMQLGVVHNEAAQTAREAGITVIMDRCMMQEHMKLTQAASP